MRQGRFIRIRTIMIEKELQEIGLQDKEAKVYLAALELGHSTVQKIAQKAEIKRPTTYFIIEGLMSRGLMSSFYQGKKQYFIAENPERLLEMLEKEKEELARRQERFRALLPQLASINNREKDKPVVKYYEGKEGILTMVSEHAKASRGHEAYSVYSRDAVDAFVSQQELNEILKERVSNKIKVRTIYTYSKGDLPPLPDTERIRLSEDEFPISCDIAVWNDRIRIASLKNRLVGVVIEDKEIAASLFNVFKLAWQWAQHKKGLDKV
jgi:sugar-specific transcriptional regulator TrmB